MTNDQPRPRSGNTVKDRLTSLSPADWLIGTYDRCAADDADALLLLRYDKDYDPTVRSQPMIQFKIDDPEDEEPMRLTIEDYRDASRWWL